MKIGLISILILLTSFTIMTVTILDWIPNNPLTKYKLIAGLQFIVIARLIVSKERRKS